MSPKRDWGISKTKTSVDVDVGKRATYSLLVEMSTRSAFWMTVDILRQT